MKQGIDLKKMKSLWYRLFGVDLRQPNDILDLFFSTIVKQYSEPRRRYHVLSHIEEGLDLLEEHRTLVNSYFHVAYAFWLHDIFYNPKMSDNEKNSAFLASGWLGLILSHIPAIRIMPSNSPAQEISNNQELVTDLILATRHQERQIDPDCQLICDLDLYRLTGEHQKEDIEDIRFEYMHLGEKEWVTGRLKFLRGILERGYIFQTPEFILRFEEKARQNIKSQITEFENKLASLDRPKSNFNLLTIFS